MNKKAVAISLVLLGAGLIFKDKIFGKSTKSLPNGSGNSIADLEGMVIGTEGNQGIYKVVNGEKVTYQDYQSYVNDGAIPLTMISGDMFNKIPGANYYISVTGIKYY